MNGFKIYLKFCNVFENKPFPKIKFKELEERFLKIYKTVYNINNESINKASFAILFISFSIIFSLSFYFLAFIGFFYLLGFSLLVSLIISYRFNTFLLKKIKKEESIINALLYLIKINFSLVVKSLQKNSDYCMKFIRLIKDYKLPISEYFKTIICNIHEGNTPEHELLNITTSSSDFNDFLRNLLLNKFFYNYNFDEFSEKSSEKSFKIFLRDIESKISILFFIGLFFPISLCFLIIFQIIDFLVLIFFVPFFLFLLNYLFKKLIRTDILLIGLLKDYSRKEIKKFDEFLQFLQSFALFLKNNLSPEKSFIMAYSQNKNYLKLLDELIRKEVANLLNLSYSFDKIINLLKFELKSERYNIILETIESMINDNAYHSSEKVLDIINTISKHRRLEEKLGIIIKGEKFKILLFLILLPLIIGAIGGMFPLMVIMTNYSDTSTTSHIILINFFDLIIIFLVLLTCNTITSFYFLKVISYEKNYIIIIFSDIIFIISFFISFNNIMSFA